MIWLTEEAKIDSWRASSPHWDNIKDYWGSPTRIIASSTTHLDISLKLAYDKNPEDRKKINELHKAIREVLILTQPPDTQKGEDK